MRPHQLGKWGTQTLAPGARQSCLFSRTTIPTCRARLQSTIAAQETFLDNRARRKDETSRIPELKPLRSSLASVSTSPSNLSTPPPPFASPAKSRPFPQTSELNFGAPPPPPEPSRYYSPEELPSPPVEAALKSAKLSALHARLGLSSRLPLETLARTLVHYSADKDGRFNNYGLVSIGDNLLSYYMSEYLLVHYPRLPMAVLQAAQFAYTGPPALMAISQEWGVEAAAEPGGEVNPGYLQFKRVAPGTPMHEDDAVEKRARLAALIPGVAKSDGKLEGATLEVASSAFVRALFAAVYLHTGAAATYEVISFDLLT